MSYVDGFILVVPEDKVDAYKKMAEGAAGIWKKHGAIDYKECVMEDANPKMSDDMPKDFSMRTFPELAGAKQGETVIFAFITYKSREHRDDVNSKVMSDPEMAEACGGEGFEMPFDPSRMAYGGFKTIVDL